jgi:hypothetical protein
MHPSIPHFQVPPAAEPSAQVRYVLWNRPVFRAPPLEPLLRNFKPADLIGELRTVRLGER